MNMLSSSLQRFKIRLLALQLFGNAGLLLAAALWLEIPDSHVWELFLSLLFGAAILTGLLVLHATILRQLRSAPNCCPLWLGAVLLGLWAVLLSLPARLIAWVSPASDQRVSYWNSQLSPHMRTIFTYERLGEWQLVTFDVVVWFLVPAFVLPFVIETVTCGLRGRTWRAGLRILAQGRYWASCIAAGLVFHWLVLPLVDWQPWHSVAAEILSVALRLGFVYVAIVLLLTLLIAFTASLLAQRDTIGDTTVQPVEDNTQPKLLDE